MNTLFKSLVKVFASIGFMVLSNITFAQTPFFKFYTGFDNPFSTSVYSINDGLIWCFQNQNSNTNQITSRILKTNFDGETAWIWTGDSSNIAIQYACEAGAGNLILGGSYTVQGVNSNQDWGLVSRVDAAGNVLWSKRMTSQTSGWLSGLCTNGSVIYALFTSYSFFSNTAMYKASVLAYNLDGELLWELPFSHSGLVSEYAFRAYGIAENGDLLAVADVRGSQFTQVNGIVLTRITPSGTISWAKHFNWRDDFNQSSVNGVAEGLDGNIYVGCRLMTDQFSTYPNALWLAKFNGNGDLLIQKMYSAGTDVGENISGMNVDQDGLNVYVKRYSPFESVQRHLDVLKLTYADLTITSAGSTVLTFVIENVSGNDSPQLAEGPDGSLYTSSIVTCLSSLANLNGIFKWTPQLAAACESQDITQLYTDSVSSFAMVDYSNSGGTASLQSNANIAFVSQPTAQALNFCDGCDVFTGVNSPKNVNIPMVYPNPAENIIFLTDDAKILEIRDLNGRILLQQRAKAGQEISIEFLPDGVYCLLIDAKPIRLIVSR